MSECGIEDWRLEIFEGRIDFRMQLLDHSGFDLPAGETAHREYLNDNKKRMCKKEKKTIDHSTPR